MSDLELQTLLGFNEEDLMSNRDCRLSTRQQEQIIRSERFNQRLFIGTGIALIAIAVGNAYMIISTTAQNHTLDVITSVGMPVLVLGFFAWSSFKLAAAKADHSVQQARGKVNFVKVEKVFPEKMPNGSIYYRTVEMYELRVGTVNFENINQALLNLVTQGDIYAVYYTKDTKGILSVDRITKGK
jgi:hypothetical protein